MKHLFIINPNAGKKNGLNYIPLIEKYFKSNDLEHEYKIITTEYKGHATKVAKEYSSKGIKRIYAVGGDGTINEVLNGIVESNSILGIIPCGTGNDFIRNLSNEKDDILKKTIEGQVKEIDIAKANDKYYINISSVGFDSEVAYNAQLFKGKKFIPNNLAYLISLFYTPFKFKPLKLNITVDDRSFQQDSMLLATSNGKCYGGGIYITPEADITDGYLDICTVRKAKLLRFLRYLPMALKGQLKSIPEVTYYRAKKVHVSSDKEFSFNNDGELLRSKKVSFEIIPKGIKVLVPTGK
ncbi:diacylglycerol/lipid kinase family protein [Haloimpatiens sp. FM7330]|uniref:diacylglycerol/lipid kinase family protein n=1 Tax=Haloimpatiens sp. FM7330 TaxID=3298610 RepID=UPI003625678C